jgi:hypothetical protein
MFRLKHTLYRWIAQNMQDDRDKLRSRDSTLVLFDINCRSCALPFAPSTTSHHGNAFHLVDSFPFVELVSLEHVSTSFAHYPRVPLQLLRDVAWFFVVYAKHIERLSWTETATLPRGVVHMVSLFESSIHQNLRQS